ncbi:MAG: DUF2157 domain-containing protein [Ruminococcus flavefaciens]|nr:DUF2157 domain-containing protein [Ruminococcus flavefaciens]MCM1229226.1 DUF2157 domain-containing protein [Ruminococcus flavefaciens]
MLKIFLILVIAGIILFIPGIITIAVVACIRADRKQREQGFPVETGRVIPPPPPPREKLSASAIMLLIGTAFVILSAITFIVANWVDMSPVGRVSALLAESVLAFGISVLLNKVIKLSRTSMAFYMIGSVVAVVALITAGYYELLGAWFSVEGDGFALLYGASALTVSALSFVAYPIYKSRAFNYIGTAFVSLAIIFLCIQPTETIDQFVAVIALAQLVITAVIHLLKPQKGTEMERPVVLIGDISAVVYQIIAGIYVLGTTFDSTVYTFAVLAVLLAQLLMYGIFKKQRWMFIFFNIIGIYTAFIATGLFEDRIGEDYTMLLFAFITLAFYIVNRLIPKNLTECHIITLVGAVIGSITALLADNDNYWLNAVVPLVTALGISSYGLNKEKAVQTASGIFSPILPFFTAVFMYSRITDSYGILPKEAQTIVYGALTAFYIAVASFYVFLPKISFGFHAKHPVQSQVIIYSNMICATAVLLNISGLSQLFMIPVALCVIHFAVSYSMSCNITATGSVISLIILADKLLDHYIGEDTDTSMYIMFGLFAVLIILSRFLFPDGFSSKTENKTLIDVILLSSWTAVMPFPFFNRTAFFLRTIALAVFLAGFIKRKTSTATATVILSFSSALACFAFMTRPFLTPDSSMIASKINIAIFAVLGIAYRYIWKNHPSASKISSTVIFIIAFASLIIDGIVFDSVANKIFVLAVTAGVLVFSFFAKSKTWFTASSIALVVMTVFSTIRYFNSAGWWLYLLIVGAVFIAIASVNEICKKNGESMKSTVAKKFSDWTW